MTSGKQSNLLKTLLQPYEAAGAFVPAPLSVTVKPVKRTDPALEDVIDSIKKTTGNFGYCRADEFIHFVQEQNGKVSEEMVLQELREIGFGFVKTPITDPQRPTEVIVDLRPMAAAMLLIYGDKEYAFQHSVLRYLKVLFLNASNPGMREMWSHHTVLDDTYGEYGHYFTIMKMADRANLAGAKESVAIERARRHVHAVNELVKNDAELTAVFHLTMHLMNALNTTGLFDAVRHRTFIRKIDDSKPRLKHIGPAAYDHFWRTANVIIDNYRGPNRPKKV